MNYYPPEKLCVNCHKQKKYYPVAIHIYKEMKIYSMYCLSCFIEDWCNTNIKNKISLFTNSKQQWEFDLKLEKRYTFQELYSENFEKVFKTEFVDQESLAFIEDLEEKMVTQVKEMHEIDKELIAILRLKCL